MNKQEIKQSVTGLLILLVGLAFGAIAVLASRGPITPLYTASNQHISSTDSIDRDFGASWDTLDTDMFPYWQEADSIYGKYSRGTDSWINTAISEEADYYDYSMNIDSVGAFIYDNYSNRFVGHITWDKNTQLDTLMQMDNI